MTNKKVRTWLIFFVKLLPLVLIIGFMLYFFRHELPDTVDEVSGTSVQYIYYTEDEFNQLDQTDFSQFKFNFSNYDGFINSVYSNYNGLNSYANIVYFYGNFTVINGSSSALMDFRLDPSGYFYYYNGVLYSRPYEFKYVDNFWIKDYVVVTSYDYDHTNYFDNVVKQFDDFTTSNFNFIDSLNLNDFYNFTVEHLVHTPSPVYHSVFNIMIYEIIVDLLLLLFGAFAFVITFARKWLEGIYEKW